MDRVIGLTSDDTCTSVALTRSICNRVARGFNRKQLASIYKAFVEGLGKQSNDKEDRTVLARLRRFPPNVIIALNYLAKLLFLRYCWERGTSVPTRIHTHDRRITQDTVLALVNDVYWTARSMPAKQCQALRKVFQLPFLLPVHDTYNRTETQFERNPAKPTNRLFFTSTDNIFDIPFSLGESNHFLYVYDRSEDKVPIPELDRKLDHLFEIVNGSHGPTRLDSKQELRRRSARVRAQSTREEQDETADRDAAGTVVEITDAQNAIEDPVSVTDFFAAHDIEGHTITVMLISNRPRESALLIQDERLDSAVVGETVRGFLNTTKKLKLKCVYWSSIEDGLVATILSKFDSVPAPLSWDDDLDLSPWQASLNSSAFDDTTHVKPYLAAIRKLQSSFRALGGAGHQQSFQPAQMLHILKQMTLGINFGAIGTFLDIGCGGGFPGLLFTLLFGKKSIGFDNDKRMVVYAKRFARVLGLGHRCEFEFKDAVTLDRAFAERYNPMFVYSFNGVMPKEVIDPNMRWLQELSNMKGSALMRIVVAKIDESKGPDKIPVEGWGPRPYFKQSYRMLTKEGGTFLMRFYKRKDDITVGDMLTADDEAEKVIEEDES